MSVNLAAPSLTDPHLIGAVQAASAIAINADVLITYDRDFAKLQSIPVLP